MLKIAVTFVLFAALAACGSGWSQAGSRGSGNTVDRAELQETNASDLYRALEMVRPNWLTGRGPVSATDPTEARANVYVDNSRMGDLSYLRNVSVNSVESVRYYEAGEASARFGMGNPRGVIQVIPRR